MFIGCIPLTNKLLAKRFLVLNGTSITRIDGSASETFNLSDISSIRVVREPDGQIFHMDIRVKNSRIRLIGFENMDVVASHLRTNCPNPVYLDTKRLFSFTFYILLVMLTVGVLFGTLGLISETLCRFACMGEILGIGIWIVIWKPFGAVTVFKRRWAELAFGIFFMVMGTLGLILSIKLALLEHEMRHYKEHPHPTIHR